MNNSFAKKKKLNDGSIQIVDQKPAKTFKGNAEKKNLKYE